MAFIIKKKIRGKDYYYLNENKRVGAKVKTKTLAYLGKNKKEAEKKARGVIVALEKKKMEVEKTEEKTENTVAVTVRPKIERKKAGVEEIATFCKRKGFIYQSAEIYGGLAGFYDYGHLGKLMKNGFEKTWKDYFLGLNENFFEIEASEIMPENVFVASGHLRNFTDVAAKCKKGHIERADYLLEKKLGKKFEGFSSEELFSEIKKNKISCLVCNGEIEYVGPINMMFPVNLGVGNITKAFLRPETAQSPYVNFKTEFGVLRNKLPLGLALIGKAYRNELSPRNFVLRQRAFTQAELQIFFNPSKIGVHEDFNSVKSYSLRVVLHNQRDQGIQTVKCGELTKTIPAFYVYHMAKVQKFYLDILKFPEDKFRFYQLNDSEKAFYNKYHFDMEADLDSLGWTEIGGVHYRTDHDLKGHQEVSKEKLEVFDEETKERFIPHVLELSFGLDRNIYTAINFSYFFDENKQNIVLKLNPLLAPVKAAIFPIVKKTEYEEISQQIFDSLREDMFVIQDKSGSIGRRYARNDEIGTPYCITVDEISKKNKDVTIRDRNTQKQVRVKLEKLKEILKKLLKNEIKFEKIS